MDKKNIELVIFDKDGLMIDSERIIYDCWKWAFGERGLPFSDELFMSLIGITDNDSRKLITELFGEGEMQKIKQLSREFFDSNRDRIPSPVKPGLFELFDAIERKGLKKAVATSATKNHAERSLGHYEILNRMDALVTGDMVSHSKPAPDIFLKCAKILGVPPSRCLVLEDSNAGITAAKRAGMSAILVPDIVMNPPEILDMCDACCETLLDVIDYL